MKPRTLKSWQIPHTANIVLCIKISDMHTSLYFRWLESRQDQHPHVQLDAVTNHPLIAIQLHLIDSYQRIIQEIILLDLANIIKRYSKKDIKLPKSLF